MKFRKLAVAVTPIDPNVVPNVGTPNTPGIPGTPGTSVSPSSPSSPSGPTTPANLPSSGFGTSASSHNFKNDKMPKFVKYAPNK